MLRIKLIKSTIANTPRNRATVKALGLGKVGSEVIQPDHPAIRGMIHHVKHLLLVTEAAADAKPKSKPKRGGVARADAPTTANREVAATTAQKKGEPKAAASPKPKAKPAATVAKKPAAKKPAAKKPTATKEQSE